MVSGCALNTGASAAAAQASLLSSFIPYLALLTAIILFTVLMVFIYRKKEKGGKKQ